MRLSLGKEVGFFVFALLLSVLLLTPVLDSGLALDERLEWLAAGLAGAWLLGRLVSVRRSWSWWSNWRCSPAWRVEASRLPLEERRVWWLPGCLSRFLAGEDLGILLGRGFQWTPRHTQELETFMRAGSQPLPTGTDGRGGYPALHAVGRSGERPLVLPFSELVGHVLIGGTTRSGKTRLLEVIVSEAMRAPGPVVVIDPKGDVELLLRAASQALCLDREFAFFSPAFPEASKTFNPLSMCDGTTELAARVQALMPGGGGMARDPFFTEYPLAVIERLGAAQQAVGDKWTIEGLHAAATLAPPFEDLIARYLHRVVFAQGGGGEVPPLAELKERYAGSGRRDLLADALIDDHDKPRDHFQKVTANLTPAFRGVTGGGVGRLLSTLPPDLSWERIVSGSDGKGMVVYFSMNSLLFGEVSNRIGRVILQDLIGFLGWRYAYGDPAGMSPVTILIDEFSNVAYPGFIDALNKGGGARAHFMLAMQSLADPEAAMGRDGAQRVMDNLNTRIWFRLTDDRTAKVATEGLGFTNVAFEESGHSLSFGGVGGLVGGASARMSRTDKPLIRPEWLTAMPRGECLVRLRGENWKLRVPLLEPVSRAEQRDVARRCGLEEVLHELQDGRASAAADSEESTQETGAAGTGARQEDREQAGAGASWMDG